MAAKVDDISGRSLIYNWNKSENLQSLNIKKLQLDDETLRDGLQSPSVTDPTIDQKIELLELMEQLRIDSADIGLPGSGPRAQADILAMARHIGKNNLSIRPNCAVRTVISDIQKLVEISEQAGYPIEACTFIGSSPIRQYVEGWSLDDMLKLTDEAVGYAVTHGLPVMYVTEDTTRADPKVLTALYAAAINAGAKRICVCDTVGHITPVGVSHLLEFIHDLVGRTDSRVMIDWHGHSDRGLALPNTMAAIAQGVNRVHATGLGIGERVGNTPMDLLLINLKLEGIYRHDLTALAHYCHCISKACDVAIPPNYPVMGKDAFRTSTGVHAAAIIKARQKGDDWLSDRVYSGVPASMVGLKQIIEIGFMSGVSNIVYWLQLRGIEPSDELVNQVFRTAKERNRVLTDEEIEDLVKYHSRETES